MVNQEQFEALCAEVESLKRRMDDFEAKTTGQILRLERSLVKNIGRKYADDVFRLLPEQHKEPFNRFSAQQLDQLRERLDKANTIDQMNEAWQHCVRQCEVFLKSFELIGSNG